jgi:hypothetical protein
VTDLSNTCEGTAGTAITNANSSGPNQFDTVTRTGTGTNSTWDSTHAHAGSTSLLHALAAVASTAYEDWTTQITPTPVANAYARFYVYLTAYPTANTRLLAFIGAAANQCAVQLLTGGTFRLVNQAGGTPATSTATLPLNAWCRIEVDCTSNTGTTANLAARLFSGANLETTTPDTGGSISASAQTVTSQVSDARYGMSSSVTMTTAWNCWYDDVAFSDTATPGPAVSGPAVTTSSLPDGTTGTAYSQTLAATGGTSPYTWSLAAGTLPAGLALSAAGVISGTPTEAGTSSFTVQVTDAASASGTKALSITISDPTSGPNSPSAGTDLGDGTGAWANPGNVTAADTNPAVWTVT